MQKLLNKSHTNVHTIAYILGGVSIFGYLVSFLRYRAFAHYFGTGEFLDIYVASFYIPDVLFKVAVAFISIYALLPMFEEKMQQGKGVFQEFINTTFYFLTLFLILGSTVLFFAVPFLGETLFDFSGESFDTFVLFSRMYLIQASLFAISTFFTAILQLKRKFLLYSILPILYNAGIIFGVIVLYPLFGAAGLAFGVLLGVLLNVGIQIPIMIQNDVLPQWMPVRRAMRELWRTIKMSVPRASAILSHGIAEVFIFSSIVSISKGALSVYYFAASLKVIPLVVIGTAYSAATFPILVTHYTKNNMNAFRSVVEDALKRLLLFILPIIGLVLVLSEPLITLQLETGAFTAEIAAVTGTIVIVAVPLALTTSVLLICARALYARGRSMMPFVVFVTLSVAEIVFSYATVQFLKGSPGVVEMVQKISGLESADFNILFAVILIMVILEMVAAIAILAVLMRDIRQRITPLITVFLQNLVAVVALMMVIAVMKEMFFGAVSFSSIKGMFAIGVMSVVGILFWYITLRLLKNEESDLIKEKIKRILGMLWKI